MIVQCDKCKTKFRIADEKVRDLGVKVRCSRCAHVFVVRRDRPSPTLRLPPIPSQEVVPPSFTEHEVTSRVPAVTQPYVKALAPGTEGALGVADPPIDDFEARTEQRRFQSPGNAPRVTEPGRATTVEGRLFVTVGVDAKLSAPPASRPAPSLAAQTGPPAVESGMGPSPFLSLTGVVQDAPARLPPPFTAEGEEDPFAEASGAIVRLVEVAHEPDPEVPKVFPVEADADPFAFVDVSLAGPSAPYSELGGVKDDVIFPPSLQGDAFARIDLGSVAPLAADSTNHQARTAVAAAVMLAPPGSVASSRSEKGVRASLVEGPVRWPVLLGLAAGLAVALFVYPGLEDWRPRPKTPDGRFDVVARDTVVVAYPTREGADRLVITGVAENRGGEVLHEVEVIVLVEEGDQIIARSSAPLGAVLDEAKLYELASAEALEVAFSDAVSEVERTLAPGGSHPFMVVLTGVPRDPAAHRYRVEFVSRRSGSELTESKGAS